MKRALALVSSLLLLALSACESMNTDSDPAVAVKASRARASASVFPYDVQRAKLANGLSVLLVPMPSEGLVSYWSVVRTGSRDEVEAGVTGFAHFFEHMMFRGSKRFPDFDKVVNGLGADSNAFTTDDFTAYHLGLTTEGLATAIEVEADRFQNLDFSEDQFKTESGAVYGEFRKGRTSPFEVWDEALRAAAFDKHTYKHTTIGFEADVVQMPNQYAYSKTFFKRFYRPENVVVVVAGDFDTKATLAKIEKEYGGWQRGYQAPAVPAEPEQTAQRRIDVEFEGKMNPMLTISWKSAAFAPTDKSMMAATLFGELAFGETSSVFQKLVLEDQTVEQLMSDFGYNRDPALWSTLAVVKQAADVAAVEGQLWAAARSLAETPVSEQRLADVRSRLKYGFLSHLSTPNNVCESLARVIAITGDIAAVDEMYATLDAITPADVQAAAAKYLKRERSTVAVVHTRGETVPSTSQRAHGDAAPVTLASAGATHFEFADARAPFTAELDRKLTQAPVLMPVSQDPNVSVKLWFQVGTQDDPAGKEGVAALTAAMITEAGTQSREYQAILAALFPLAAGYGNSVDKEMTIVSGTAHRDVAARFVDIFLDAVVHPGFREADFTRLRDQLVSGIENDLRFGSDEELAKAMLTQSLFSGTRYAHIDNGTVASLKALTLDDVKDFYATHFTRDNVVLGLGGAYSPELRARIEAALAALPSGRPARALKPAIQPPKGRHLTIVDKADPKDPQDDPRATTSISFGYPIDLLRGSREFYALWIANSWLGEHRSSVSHLYQVIRESRGMNYGDYSYIEAYPNGGSRQTPPSGVGRRQQAFEVWIRSLPRDQAPFALRAALREVELLAKNGLTREQFDYQRKFLKNYCLHFAETTGERLGWALDDRFYALDGKGGHLSTFRRMMDEITLEECNAAIKKYIRADDFDIAIVTKGGRALADVLMSGAPTPITYGTGAAPEMLKTEDGVTVTVEPDHSKDALHAEDREIESWRLGIRPEDVTIVPVAEAFAGSATKANN
jgi:zinc protease